MGEVWVVWACDGAGMLEADEVRSDVDGLGG